MNTGKAAEFLAASVMQSRQADRWEVVFAGVRRIDLVAFSGPHVVRVQVKSTLAPRKATKRALTRYEFLVYSLSAGARCKLTKADCDIVALVALDIRLCQFMPVEKCTKIHWRIPPEEFTVENQERTLREVFEKYERRSD
jgi:hypothetical protein